MSDEQPQKRSVVLAVENVKRIADQLRSERNDALALAQVDRERGDKLAALLADAREVMRSLQGDLAPEANARIDALLERIGRSLDPAGN
jgi:hypothetical protein